MRKLRSSLTDSTGIEVSVAWRVKASENDSHEDGLAAALEAYRNLVGDSPVPQSMNFHTTFEGPYE